MSLDLRDAYKLIADLERDLRYLRSEIDELDGEHDKQTAALEKRIDELEAEASDGEALESTERERDQALREADELRGELRAAEARIAELERDLARERAWPR